MQKLDTLRLFMTDSIWSDSSGVEDDNDSDKEGEEGLSYRDFQFLTKQVKKIFFCRLFVLRINRENLTIILDGTKLKPFENYNIFIIVYLLVLKTRRKF